MFGLMHFLTMFMLTILTFQQQSKLTRVSNSYMIREQIVSQIFDTSSLEAIPTTYRYLGEVYEGL